ncbi:hypothetical protein A3B87_00465 [Candidatus Kuenenbacteria bacterium RIFCSPHIGHO2_02_FULL_39_13]|uniref:Uncharacterized protein n=1 Tax=Candidatus Kuenenbacteria bacterium RIFCSPHIGHO2_02_FULL_39_13 TaxID=1798561 RepID=A0A1F6FP05_9BACT|nr:MAG: hypothetical protein A3B87_00465 [Candidatus Kuenenbacteria bacterium RIFCSPHIGHO2_02_FULL_39_13]
MYWPAKEYDLLEAEIVGHLKRNDGWLDNYCRRELKKAEYLYELGLRLKKIDWAKRTSQEMKKVLDDLLNKYRDVACPWYAQYSIDVYYEDILEEQLLKYIKADHPDFRKFVLVFTDPQEETDVAGERWRLMKLAKKFKENKEKLNQLSKIYH